MYMYGGFEIFSLETKQTNSDNKTIRCFLYLDKTQHYLSVLLPSENLHHHH